MQHEGSQDREEGEDNAAVGRQCSTTGGARNQSRDFWGGPDPAGRRAECLAPAKRRDHGGELKALSKGAGADLSLAEQWKWEARRTDLARQMRGHEEYARFLDFVKRRVSRSRTYRVTLQDLSQLEIMPKGSYL